MTTAEGGGRRYLGYPPPPSFTPRRPGPHRVFSLRAGVSSAASRVSVEPVQTREGEHDEEDHPRGHARAARHPCVRGQCGGGRQDHGPSLRPPRRRHGRHHRKLQQRRHRSHPGRGHTDARSGRGRWRAAAERAGSGRRPCHPDPDDGGLERLLLGPDHDRRLCGLLLLVRRRHELDGQPAPGLSDRHLGRGLELLDHAPALPRDQHRRPGAGVRPLGSRLLRRDRLQPSHAAERLDLRGPLRLARPVDDAGLPLHRARRARAHRRCPASSRTKFSSRSTAASTARMRAASRGRGATSTSAGHSSSATTATTASTSAAPRTAASRTRSRRRSPRGCTAASSATSASRATAPST